MIKVKYPRKFVPTNGFNGPTISVDEYSNPLDREKSRSRVRHSYAAISDNVKKIKIIENGENRNYITNKANSSQLIPTDLKKRV